MTVYDQIIPILPDQYAVQIRRDDMENLQEIRLRMGHPILLRYQTGERFVAPLIRRCDLEEVLSRACHHSVYAYSEMISQGYLTLACGHRIGICGMGVMMNGEVQGIRDVSSLNIRIAHDVKGCSNELISNLYGSALIVGPPGSGKTTLLRDTIRQLSDNKRLSVGVADERGELFIGGTDCTLGKRTDVLQYIPKRIAMVYLLRTMAPDWIAVDEITAQEDIEAIEHICYCGVKLLATAHGSGIEDLLKRTLYQKLLSTGWFQQVVLLNKDKSYTVEDYP